MDWTLSYWTSTAGLMILAIAGLALWKAKIFPAYARLGRNLTYVAGGLWVAGTLGIFSIASVVGGGGGTTAAATAPQVSLAGCPDDGTTDVQADVFSKSNSSGGEYLVTTLSLYPVSADGSLNTGSRYTYASAPTATRTAAVSVPCGKYKAFAAAIRDNATGLYGAPMEFDAVGGAVVKTFYVDEQGGVTGLTVRGYDLDNNAFVYGNDSLDGTNTAYETVRTTLQSTTNNTAYVFALDGSLNWKFQFAAGTAGTVVGGSDKTWLCIDRATSEVDKPVSVKFNGAELAEAKTQMHPDDAAQLSAFDDCYVLPRPINDIQGNNNIEMSLRAKSGQNPSTDIPLRILSQDWMLDKDSRTMVSRIFRPSDSRQEVNSRDFSTTIDIS